MLIILSVILFFLIVFFLFHLQLASFFLHCVTRALVDQIKPITRVKPQFPRANSDCEKDKTSQESQMLSRLFQLQEYQRRDKQTFSELAILNVMISH